MVGRIRRERVVSIEARADVDVLNVLVDKLGPVRHEGARQQLRRLAEAFDAPPPKSREVVWMQRVDELWQKEVARRRGITEGPVDKNIARGVRLLAESMFGVHASEGSRWLDSIDRLSAFSTEPEYCGGKVPVATDRDGTIAGAYELKVDPAAGGFKDSRSAEADHGLAERTTFIVTPNRKIAATVGGLAPTVNVDRALAEVQRLASAKQAPTNQGGGNIESLSSTTMLRRHPVPGADDSGSVHARGARDRRLATAHGRGCRRSVQSPGCPT